MRPPPRNRLPFPGTATAMGTNATTNALDSQRDVILNMGGVNARYSCDLVPTIANLVTTHPLR